MFVYYDMYYDITGGKYGVIVVYINSYPETQGYPSECIWMVPGTVDPMED
jgi:hypothetical protein